MLHKITVDLQEKRKRETGLQFHFVQMEDASIWQYNARISTHLIIRRNIKKLACNAGEIFFPNNKLDSKRWNSFFAVLHGNVTNISNSCEKVIRKLDLRP